MKMPYRARRLPIRALMVIWLIGQTGAVSAVEQPLANRLADSPSPYLALHGGDPVAWQSWDASPIARASREGKLLYVSIGYFSCHWCHVMQRESYRNQAIANVLNTTFIPVKVDRELEPALDRYLIEFVSKTTGRAGWPLNVFLTPDGYPLLGVTYMPPESFQALLEKLAKRWRGDAPTLSRIAKRATELVNASLPGPLTVTDDARDGYFTAFAEQALELADEMSGGFGNGNKFPSAPQLSSLIEYIATRDAPREREFLTTTLQHMADGGLRDHLGGGFFRYATDPQWRVPHFEKMLYDNAQLALVYLRAGQVLNEPRWAAVARETLDFMIAELWDPRGAFIASLSAVDDGDREGGYYLWHEQELKDLLTAEEWPVARTAFSLEPGHLLAEGWLPAGDVELTEIARTNETTPDSARALLAAITGKMLVARSRRNAPRDHKLLAGWNGLALSALSAAATDGKRYRSHADRLARYIQQRLWSGQKLRRAASGDKAYGQATLQDYAFVARGLLDYAGLSGESEYRDLAGRIADRAWALYRTEHGWRFSARNLLPGIPPEPVMTDDPMPSPSAVLLATSLRFSATGHWSDLAKRAAAALREGVADMADSPFFYATHIAVLADHPAR